MKDKAAQELQLIAYARELRKNVTDAERRLWARLRLRNLGCRFRRQAPVGPYILDFVCFEKRVAIELDGGQHLDSPKDRERDSWLMGQGFKVLRFWDNEVLANLDGVLEAIRQELAGHDPPTPSLPHTVGREKSTSPPP